MRWLAVLPIILFGLVVFVDFAVTLYVEITERQRGLRNSVPVRNEFRPVLIEGGKSQAPPGGIKEAGESKIKRELSRMG